MKSLSTLVESEVRPLSSGEVMHLPPESMSSAERVTAYALIKWMQDRLEKQRELLRLALMKDAESLGTETESGGRRCMVEGSTLRVDKRTAKLPDEEKFKVLLATHHIEESAVYDKVVTTSLVLNPSKIQALVETGKLEAKAVDALKKPTFALTLEPAAHIEALLEASFKSFAAQKEALVEGAPALPALPAPKRAKKGKAQK